MSGPAFKIYSWRASAMILFSGAESPVHEHIAAQLAVGVDGPARVRARDGEWMSADAVLVPQSVAHGYDAREGIHCVLWVEPQSLAGRHISRVYPGDDIRLLGAVGWSDLRDRIREAFAGESGPEEGTALRSALLTRLLGELPSEQGALDASVRQAVDVLFAHRDQDLSVVDLARKIGVSESHLSHKFSEQIGVPVSRYRMWLRVLEASRNLGRGETVTAAAHNAGFSDAAHLSRTFKRLFGQSPGALSNESALLAVYACEDVV